MQTLYNTPCYNTDLDIICPSCGSQIFYHEILQKELFLYKIVSLYEGQSKITEPYLITFELSKMDIYLDDISLKLYVIYLITKFICVGRLFVMIARQQNTTCQRGAFTL